MSYYTLAVYYTNMKGERVREIVNPDWKMSFMMADEMAGNLNAKQQERTYKAVNCNEIHQQAQPA